MSSELNCIGCGKKGCDGKAGCEWYDNKNRSTYTQLAAQEKAKRDGMERYEMKNDLKFLDEILMHVKGANRDAVHYEYAITMIQDWRDELKNRLKILSNHTK